MGWWFTTSFWAKEKQETVSDFLPGVPLVGGYCLITFLYQT